VHVIIRDVARSKNKGQNSHFEDCLVNFYKNVIFKIGKNAFVQEENFHFSMIGGANPAPVLCTACSLCSTDKPVIAKGGGVNNRI
jgi:hypothetical protein